MNYRLTALSQAEYSNYEAMVREAKLKNKEAPPLPDYNSMLDSWLQMPDFIRDELYPEGWENVEEIIIDHIVCESIMGGVL